jgi:hypothetical protein
MGFIYGVFAGNIVQVFKYVGFLPDLHWKKTEVG